MPKPTLRQLFFQMFTISAFTFGGGFVIVSLMKSRLVEQRGWLTQQEMLDMTALAQSAPGPIAVNTAVLLGWQLRGFPGMLAAVSGCVLPPLVTLSAISLCYEAFVQNPYAALLLRGMQAGVAAVVLSAALSLSRDVLALRSPLHTALLLASFALTLIFRCSPAVLLLSAAVLGTVRALRTGGTL